MLAFDAPWIESIGARFTIEIGSGLALLMVLLTSFIFPSIYVFINNKVPENQKVFYGLMSFSQMGLLGVFLAKDALLFYGFWEVALIPVYFLASLYGGSRRIAVTFKFFFYTFVGSLLMLVAILYIYQHTPNHSFSWNDFVETGKQLPLFYQNWLFWLLFVAFAIKMQIGRAHV